MVSPVPSPPIARSSAIYEGGHQRVKDIGRRQADPHEVHEDRSCEVLPDDATGAPGDAEEHDVGALARDTWREPSRYCIGDELIDPALCAGLI
jgi:hypothetical protein